jgi:hypothetical protein
VGSFNISHKDGELVKGKSKKGKLEKGKKKKESLVE